MSYLYSHSQHRIIGGVISFILTFSMVFSYGLYPAQIVYAEEDSEESQAHEQSSGQESENDSSGSGGEGGSGGDAAVIKTGDASSETFVENQVNTNIENGGSLDSTEGSGSENSKLSEEGEGVGGEESESKEEFSKSEYGTENEGEVSGNGSSSDGEEEAVASEEGSESEGGGIEGLSEDTEEGPSLSIENKNDANVETTVESISDTGDNAASGSSGGSSVTTGDAYSLANVANIINSNFVGSEGFLQFLNLFGGSYGDIELSFDSGTSCSFFCFITNLFIHNINNASVASNVLADASSGGNNASSTGDSIVQTGDAFAAANVMNIVNTNVISSDYLAFILNAFGSWEGDLVLPPEVFFNSSSDCDECEALQGSVNVTNKNTAEIENTGITSADTGNNSAIGTSTSITTGNAYAASNMMTVANTNILGDNFLLIYVRTGGSWSGQIFSLPRGLRVIGTDNGFIIDSFSSRFAASTLAGFVEGSGSTTIRNTSGASVHNTVTALASTGANSSGGDSAVINTGNAYAASNILNIVNSNFIGRNWLFAMVNIFGDWNGNLAFGRPDIWLGSSAHGPSQLTPGAETTYTLTYRNNGNARATDVVITSNYGDLMNITNPGGGDIHDLTRRVTWNIGDLEPGESGSVSFTAKAGGATIGTSKVINHSCVDSFEEDGNKNDNCDTIDLDLYVAGSSYGGGDSTWARLEIIKEVLSGPMVARGGQTEYRITVDNRGSKPAYNVIVTDELENEAGDILNTYAWNFGTIEPGAVEFTYTLEYATSTEPGIYTNYAIAEWYDENGNYADHSGHSSASVEVFVGPESGLEKNFSSGSGLSSDNFNFVDSSGERGVSGAGGSESAPVVDEENNDLGSEEDTASEYSEENILPVGIVSPDNTRGSGVGTIGASLEAAGRSIREVRESIPSSVAPGRNWRELAAGLPFISLQYSYLWALIGIALIAYVVVIRRREQ